MSLTHGFPLLNVGTYRFGHASSEPCWAMLRSSDPDSLPVTYNFESKNCTRLEIATLQIPSGVPNGYAWINWYIYPVPRVFIVLIFWPYRQCLGQSPTCTYVYISSKSDENVVLVQNGMVECPELESSVQILENQPSPTEFAAIETPPILLSNKTAPVGTIGLATNPLRSSNRTGAVGLPTGFCFTNKTEAGTIGLPITSIRSSHETSSVTPRTTLGSSVTPPMTPPPAPTTSDVLFDSKASFAPRPFLSILALILSITAIRITNTSYNLI